MNLIRFYSKGQKQKENKEISESVQIRSASIPYALFSSRNFFGFDNVALTLLFWQLMFNYRLIKLKRFVSC